MKIIIQEYRKKDKKILLECLKALINHLISLNPLRRKKVSAGFLKTYETEILKKINKKECQVFFAKKNGKVVDYVMGFLEKQSKRKLKEFLSIKYGEIEDLFVCSRYRNKGVGTLLIRSIENFFHQVGCRMVKIEVLASNKRAYKLYKELRYKNYSVEMIKRI